MEIKRDIYLNRLIRREKNAGSSIDCCIFLFLPFFHPKKVSAYSFGVMKTVSASECNSPVLLFYKNK